MMMNTNGTWGATTWGATNLTEASAAPTLARLGLIAGWLFVESEEAMELILFSEMLLKFDYEFPNRVLKV
jgi:hypothetical protein